MEMKKVILGACLTMLLAAGTANAALVAEWDLTGKTGAEVSDAATQTAANVSGVDLTRGSALTASSASNGFGSTGWAGTNENQYYQFGFTVASGYQASLSELWIATRSSSTGPGTMGVYGSSDNFAHETLLATFTQPSAIYLNSKIDLSGLAAITGTYLVRLKEIGDTAPNGYATANTGTFRVANYYDGTYTPTGFYGDVTSATPTPLPAAAWLLGSGLLGLAGIKRRQG
ncbi:MAG: hypothetical protein CXR30_18580 [Geobacter sp.]|nr:MAG: hypothetical protein CXR30_18580 [Geobacter sp.]